MNTATEFMIEAQEQQETVLQTIFEELKDKSQVIFNPELLTWEQREEVIQAVYREDIYRIVTPEGNWKIWRRIFN